jgi:predicted nucleic acid-binding protein
MILVDSSVWMDYFKGGEKSFYLEILLRRNLIQINDVVLAEITPPLILRKQNTLVEILDSIKSKPIEVYWPGIIDLQILNLKNGINKIGIPDLILVQHCLVHNLELWSFDKHFELMAGIAKLKLFNALSSN